MLQPKDVTDWLKAKDVGQDDMQLRAVVGSVNAYVSRLPVVRRLPTPEDGGPATWPEDVKLGATMLASRLWRRRNSPNGVEAVTDAGTTYVARHDPDVSRLLQLDGYAPPMVG